MICVCTRPWRRRILGPGSGIRTAGSSSGSAAWPAAGHPGGRSRPGPRRTPRPRRRRPPHGGSPPLEGPGEDEAVRPGPVGDRGRHPRSHGLVGGRSSGARGDLRAKRRQQRAVPCQRPIDPVGTSGPSRDRTAADTPPVTRSSPGSVSMARRRRLRAPRCPARQTRRAGAGVHQGISGAVAADELGEPGRCTPSPVAWRQVDAVTRAQLDCAPGAVAQTVRGRVREVAVSLAWPASPEGRFGWWDRPSVPTGTPSCPCRRGAEPGRWAPRP